MSLANNKRKQDDKNLTILRDFASQTANRACFDCKQKGPTYVNMTIGSFVCTSCSGLLRGLNPPHRVKSISMASFTNEEIDTLKSKGNEYCRTVWMGHYNENTNFYPESKDVHKILELMLSKYEKKKYYVEPEAALKNAESKPKRSPVEIKSMQSNGKMEPSLSAFKLPAPHSFTSAVNLNKPKVNANGLSSSSIARSSSLGFLSGPSTAPVNSDAWDQEFEPFNPPPSKVNFSNSSDFANFENANIFVSSQTSTVKSTSVPFSLSSNPLTPISPSLNVLNSTPTAVSMATEDRYAALKDLDEAFKFQKEVTKENKATDPNYNNQISGSSHQGFIPSAAGGWANFDSNNFETKEPPSTNPWASASSNPFVSPQAPASSQPSYNPFL